MPATDTSRDETLAGGSFRGLRKSVYDLIKFSVATCLPIFISSWILPLDDHFAFHEDSSFEGYYTRIQSSKDDSSLVFIFSSVPNAGTNGNGEDRYPQKIAFTNIQAPNTKHDGFRAFRVQADNFGLFAVDRESQYYWLCLPDPDDEDCELHISARLTHRTPLQPSNPLYVPHNSVIRLGSIIPLHWHIFSTHSLASYLITRVRRIYREDGSYRRDENTVAEGSGFAHVEKNWGDGFPEGWTWGQGFSPTPSSHASASYDRPTSTLAFAGGTTGFPFLKSYLVIYRSPSKNILWDFAAPWTSFIAAGNTSLFGPFVRERFNHDGRKGMRLEVSTLTRRLVIHADGSKPASTDKWLPLDCPLSKGHGNITARETFSAGLLVSAYERPWWLVSEPWAWKLVDHQMFKNAAWELGGNYRSRATIASDNRLWRSISYNWGRESNGSHYKQD
ncbi:hypothetical protein SCHPADRAFT_155174 [Schizopora paradoxa]|uniref:Uncharacterized protein n=1 Tax=Schizopora paradoxa TaxID=27342 RepID=A0A0H2S1C9_9AGAM|nr:hypothetical protein SCHPADRAFT_155174 [Schizopora paradoxa]